jgi:hypothetical protein
LDFPARGCRQVHGPLEVLLRWPLVASYVAADADGVASGSVQRSSLNADYSLASADLRLQVGGRKGDKNR